MARALAVLVHAFTGLLVVGAAVLAVLPVWVGFKVALCGLLLATAWQVRPRRVPLPEGTAVGRPQAPLLFALLDRIATATATTPPAHVVFDGGTRATTGYGGGGRYLRVGLPLWLSLGSEGRVIVLADQLGRLDARNDSVAPVVQTALRTLGEWEYFFNPRSATLEDGASFDMAVREGRGNRGGRGVSGLAYLLLPVVLFPFHLVVSGVRRALTALAASEVDAGVARGRRAAAELSPSAPSVLAVAPMQAETALVQMETAARRDARADLWAAVDPVGLVTSPLLDAPTLASLDAEVRALTAPTLRAISDAARF